VRIGSWTSDGGSLKAFEKMIEIWKENVITWVKEKKKKSNTSWKESEKWTEEKGKE